MRLSKRTEWMLRLSAGFTLAFIYIPLLVILLYAFNSSQVAPVAAARADVRMVRQGARQPRARDALLTSLKAGAAATAIALVLGTLASLAVARHKFFGRETISFLVILPIALPGIVTGVALNTSFTQILGNRPEPVHDRRRPRNLLHRRRLQQRRRQAAAGQRVARGGERRPRRRPVDDLPPGHAAEPADGVGGRRTACLRSELRRDHRHHVHRRHRRADAAAVDLPELLTAQPAARWSTSSR